MKFRSSTGSSVSSFVSKRVATSARSVFRSGDPPVTSTVSVSCPTSRLKLTGVCVSTLTRTLGTTADLETRELGFDFVVAGNQPVLDVETGFVGDDGIDGLALDAGDRDGDARQRAAARVGDGAADAAIHGLRGRRWCEPHQRDRDGEPDVNCPKRSAAEHRTSCDDVTGSGGGVCPLGERRSRLDDA